MSNLKKKERNGLRLMALLVILCSRRYFRIHSTGLSDKLCFAQDPFFFGYHTRIFVAWHNIIFSDSVGFFISFFYIYLCLFLVVQL